MKIRWTKPIPVEKLLEQGGKYREFIPEKTGIYRFQVVPLISLKRTIAISIQVVTLFMSVNAFAGAG